MVERKRAAVGEVPEVRFRTPTLRPENEWNAPTQVSLENPASHDRLKAGDASAADREGRGSLSPNPEHHVYLGSYVRRRSRPRSSAGPSSGVSTPAGSVPPSPRRSVSQLQLQHLLKEVDAEQETYGVEELRDGFFDALFFPSKPMDQTEMEDMGRDALPSEMKSHQPLSMRYFFQGQWREVRDFGKKVATTPAGIKLTKSFLGFFIAYIICLIPPARDWLGRYNYIMALSTILNHAGRTVGSQVEGAVLTTLGTIFGLGWGSLALYVSTSTGPAKAGYGGLLAMFMIILIAFVSYLRCRLIRFYQFVICAGISICYMCLTEVSRSVHWLKVFEFGIPWVLGQVVALIVCVTVFPDAGSRPFAIALHGSMEALKRSLRLPRVDDRSTRQELAWHFVNLSNAVRDLTIDISITRFNPEDARMLRNLIQSVIRGVLAVKSSTVLFDLSQSENPIARGDGRRARHNSAETLAITIAKTLVDPSKAVISSMILSIECCDAALMDLSGFRKYLGPPMDTPTDLTDALRTLENALEVFDTAESLVFDDETLMSGCTDKPEIVELLLFVHPLRQVADNVKVLHQKVSDVKRSMTTRLRFYPPSYPFVKSLNRTNAQVRHDRGGLTAGFYFRSKVQLQRTMDDLQSRAYIPLPHHQLNEEKTHSYKAEVQGEKEEFPETHLTLLDTSTARYRIWDVLHDLQGFESRFALKVVLVTTLVSIPAWLSQSEGWWNEGESWWAVVMAWLMMHPRVGGNFQDLATRVLTALIGAIWGGFAFAADNGNPYIMAVFAAILMIPMLYRYSQSSHPRSGMAGCMSFTVVSLSAYTRDAPGGIFHFTWTLACAFMVGTAAAVVVNWVLWPFVARHELRKSVSTMMLHMAISYRGVVAQYIYYLKSEPPTAQDIEKSEMLEGRLREGFIRMRQLLILTRHEIRLRAPFDPRPYALLIESCEAFFEDLVQVRQSSLYFQPKMHQLDNPATGGGGQAANMALLSYRRDAAATILMNLYVLAGALKSYRPVPRYLPSAVAARKRLLDKMAEVEHEGHAGEDEDQDEGFLVKEEGTKGTQPSSSRKRRWADVYQYAFGTALTDIVERLERLQQITKCIVGEVGFDIKDFHDVEE